MKRHCKAACIVLGLGTILFGILFPLLIWVVAHIFCPWEAEGSQIIKDGRVMGLQQIEQPFTKPSYFSGRPSVADLKGFSYISGGSNASWTSPSLRSTVEARLRSFAEFSHSGAHEIPVDMIMASASGCDPDISIKAALIQLSSVAAARHIDEETLLQIILANEENTFFGLFPRRVNVVKLNLLLDEQFPVQ